MEKITHLTSIDSTRFTKTNTITALHCRQNGKDKGEAVTVCYKEMSETDALQLLYSVLDCFPVATKKRKAMAEKIQKKFNEKIREEAFNLAGNLSQKQNDSTKGRFTSAPRFLGKYELVGRS